MTARPVGVALVGSGNISRRYARGIALFPELRLIGVTDSSPQRAAALAGEMGVKAYGSLAEILADPAAEIVVNITPPAAHADVTGRAIAAGKHVYVEKPLALAPADARAAIAAAASRGVAFGAAPDTFLGSSHQTARAAVDGGLLGDVIGAFVSIPHTHIETWHPDPRAFFAPGGGPVLDLGPYYVTALVGLLGPVVEVAAMSRVGSTPRHMTAPDRVVESIAVTVDTHAGALLRFANGVLATTQMSFDVWNTGTPNIELYGTRGTLQIPDPNQYDGPVRFRAIDADEWTTLPPATTPFGRVGTDDQYLRGPGVADLARSLTGEPFRVDATLAAHVLDVLVAVDESSASHGFVAVSSSAPRPAAVTTSVSTG